MNSKNINGEKIKNIGYIDYQICFNVRWLISTACFNIKLTKPFAHIIYSFVSSGP
jgi:hypothetical protein